MSGPRIAAMVTSAGLLVAVAVLTVSCRQADQVPTGGVLGVDQIATSPASFAGREIRLAGVVSAVMPERHMFAVIDQAEYGACNVVTCSQYEVPIAYAGDLPAVEDSVTITGRLVQPEPGRYLFQAVALEATQ